MFGSYIKSCREKLGWSCAELARKSGHPVSSIHGIETGSNRNPRFQIIIDIGEALHISLDDMKKAFKSKEEQNDS